MSESIDVKELEDIQTSLIVRGTVDANEWILDLAYRLYDAIETHKEKVNDNENSN